MSRRRTGCRAGVARVAVVDGHPLVTEAIGRSLVSRFRAVPVPLQNLRTTADARKAVLRARASVAVVILPTEGRMDALTLVSQLTGEGVGVVVAGVPPVGESFDDYAAVGASPLRSPHPQIADLIAAIDNELCRLATAIGTVPTVVPAPRRQAPDPFGSLTAAESRILWQLMKGRGPEDIAHENVVSLATVRTQIAQILRKLGVRSQLAAVALAWESGWVLPVFDAVA